MKPQETMDAELLALAAYIYVGKPAAKENALPEGYKELGDMLRTRGILSKPLSSSSIGGI